MENVVLLPHLGSATAGDPRGDGHARARESPPLLPRRSAPGSGRVTVVALEPFAAAALPESADPAAASAAAYATEVVELLSGLLLAAGARARSPRSSRCCAASGGRRAELPSSLARTLQVQGIWFQLLSIAEQNAAMRRRRQIEARAGPRAAAAAPSPRSFARAAASGVTAADVRALLEALRVRPVITAHPTEAKRVTVLEKHRRIYRRLVDLESPRWTPRERQALVDGLRNDIELLWLTGELRLAKPTVPQEVYWGLHFFNETLFEAVPDLMEKVERALEQYYPGRDVQRPRRSSSSAPGSAATATAIRSSPMTSPAARCWRTG